MVELMPSMPMMVMKPISTAIMAVVGMRAEWVRRRTIKKTRPIRKPRYMPVQRAHNGDWCS